AEEPTSGAIAVCRPPDRQEVAFEGEGLRRRAHAGDAALAGPLSVYKRKTDAPEFFKDLVWDDFEQGADAELLEQFVGYFPELKDGQECTLRWRPGGSLEVTMVGEARPPIADKAFAA